MTIEYEDPFEKIQPLLADLGMGGEFKWLCAAYFNLISVLRRREKVTEESGNIVLLNEGMRKLLNLSEQTEFMKFTQYSEKNQCAKGNVFVAGDVKISFYKYGDEEKYRIAISPAKEDLSNMNPMAELDEVIYGACSITWFNDKDLFEKLKHSGVKVVNSQTIGEKSDVFAYTTNKGQNTIRLAFLIDVKGSCTDPYATLTDPDFDETNLFSESE